MKDVVKETEPTKLDNIINELCIRRDSINSIEQQLRLTIDRIVGCELKDDECSDNKTPHDNLLSTINSINSEIDGTLNDIQTQVQRLSRIG